MGRALFSTIYTQDVAVRTESDVPDPLDFPRCEKWSISNPFDPDSDEFNESATREVFTDTEAWRAEQEAMRELLAVQARRRVASSSSSEASESDSGSPMAVGSDDPSVLFADAFHDADWRERLSAIGASHAAEAEARSQRITRRHSSTTSPGFIPPPFLHSSPEAIEYVELPPMSPPQSPTLQRTVPITPINIPIEPSPPSPPPPATPSTPIDNVFQNEMSSMMTPSPPPSVTPHVYTWRRAQLTVQTSPLANLGNPGGPLTNPSARLSFVRLDATPTRVHIQNSAV